MLQNSFDSKHIVQSGPVCTWCLTICFFHRRRPVQAQLTLKGWNTTFVNNVKYLVVILDRKLKWEMRTETIAAKAFRKSIRIYSLLKSERLSANSELTLHKALIRSVMTYACPAWEF
jgi:hypothetical protein